MNKRHGAIYLQHNDASQYKSSHKYYASHSVTLVLFVFTACFVSVVKAEASLLSLILSSPYIMPLALQPCISRSTINHQVLSLLSHLIDVAITVSIFSCRERKIVTLNQNVVILPQRVLCTSALIAHLFRSASSEFHEFYEKTAFGFPEYNRWPMASKYPT